MNILLSLQMMILINQFIQFFLLIRWLNIAAKISLLRSILACWYRSSNMAPAVPMQDFF